MKTVLSMFSKQAYMSPNWSRQRFTASMADISISDFSLLKQNHIYYADYGAFATIQHESVQCMPTQSIATRTIEKVLCFEREF